MFLYTVYIGLFILHICVAFYNMAHFENACILHFQNHLWILGNLISVYLKSITQNIWLGMHLHLKSLGPPTHGYHIFSFSFHNNVYSNHEHREYTFLQYEINMIRVRSNALNHELKKSTG